MAKGSPRAPLMGPAFIRLLARFNDAAAGVSPPALSEQLNAWFDWNRAVVLSKALDGAPATVQAPLPAVGGPAAEAARVRETLSQVIRADIAGPADSFEPYQQHYLAAQRAMLTATGRLRGRLRDLLASQAGAQAQLAELDAVMEATLSPRELALLSRVPGLLQRHFEVLLTGASGDPSPGTTPSHSAEPLWHERFAQDLRHALLAELEFRFQPIEGLLAALIPRQ